MRSAPIVKSVNGLLIVDKPSGMTSHDVVARLRRATGEKSIGHLGTLDPMATGVLPLLLGKFTRLAQFCGAHEKAYTGTIRFGFSTDTYDAEGTPTSEPKHPSFTLEQLRAASTQFFGEIDQLPPPISAKKIDGKPAYTEFLALLIQDEVARRERKKFDLRLRRATFRATKTLEQSDFERLPKLNRALVNELATGR